MKESVKYIGGRLEIESNEYGTQVKATIPSFHFRSAPSATAAGSN
jgi:signal transduction histidine kinase